MSTRTILTCLSAVLVAYIYVKYRSTMSGDDFERIILSAWEGVIKMPPETKKFKRLAIGVNSCVDMVVPGVDMMKALGLKPVEGRDRPTLANLKELESTFSYFLAKGTAAERHTTDAEQFQVIVEAAETLPDRQLYVGGNAGLIAAKVGDLFPGTNVQLVSPIGPILQKLLPKAITVPKASLIERDMVHLIMEYSAGQKWGTVVAPAACRFITSFDELNSKLASLEIYFATLDAFNPDLLVVSGLHMMELTPPEMQIERLTALVTGLKQIPPSLPSHLELASMADNQFIKNVLEMVIPRANSLGLNEQELVSLAEAVGGPHDDHFRDGHIQPPVHVVMDILLWLMQTYGRSGSVADSRLTRIHFHCLTFHIIATLPNSGWSNSAEAVAAGARMAGLQAGDVSELTPELVELQAPTTFKRFSGDEEQKLVPSKPVMAWSHGGVDFVFTPVLVCKKVVKTVGLGDAISATGLMYSSFSSLPPQ